MNRPILILLLVMLFSVVHGQRERLPADLRQHNLTTFNSSLFNPSFSLGRNNPESVALWVRWQWQGIDADPSTLFLNYTRPLNERSAAGAAFFQHNTGIFFNTGAAFNYAYKFEFNPRVKLSVGANLFGFVQKLADDRFQGDSNLPLPLPQSNDTNDFILQIAPGVSLEIERLTISLASENLLDYNFNAKEGNTAKEDKIFMSLLSYDFPITLGSATNAFLRPSMYLRTIPGQSNQVGFYTHLNTDRYYGQIGYNNFYGVALGGGYTFFDRVTVGALMEIGTGASIQKQTSFELMASYFLGTRDERHKMVGHDIDEADKNALDVIEEQQNEEKEEEQIQEEEIAEEVEKEEAIAGEEKLEQERKEAAKLQRKREKMVQDSLAKVEKAAAVAAQKKQKELDKETARQAKEEEALKKEEARKAQKAEEKKSKKAEPQKAEKDVEAEEVRAEAVRKEQARKTDSISKARQAEAAALKKEQQRRIDSVAQARAAAIKAVRTTDNTVDGNENEAEVNPQAGEKYEEVQTEDGLKPGFYLIANVFGTKKYFDAFMADLRAKGIRPKSFQRGKNNYNYAYLEHYETIGEARTARDSNYGGKYTGNTWIFRVVSE